MGHPCLVCKSPRLLNLPCTPLEWSASSFCLSPSCMGAHFRFHLKNSWGYELPTSEISLPLFFLPNFEQITHCQLINNTLLGQYRLCTFIIFLLVTLCPRFWFRCFGDNFMFWVCLVASWWCRWTYFLSSPCFLYTESSAVGWIGVKFNILIRYLTRLLISRYPPLLIGYISCMEECIIFSLLIVKRQIPKMMTLA